MKYFRRKKKLQVELISYEKLQFNPKPYMDNVINNKIIVHITKVFNEAELKQIKKILQSVPEKFKNEPHPGALTIPPACSSGGPNQNALDEFFKNSTQYNTFLEESTPVVNRFGSLMQLLNNNSPLQLASNSQHLPYIHGTFRYIVPDPNGVGLTTPHTGLDYVERNIAFSYKPLDQQIDVFKQLSLFVVIEKPETGGDFTVFNLSKTEFPIQDKGGLKHKSNGKIVQFYDPKEGFITLKMEEGDCVLFADFELWHRVEQVLGNKSRISYGCWIGKGKNNKLKYYWS